jgi:hypothetical protein
MPYNPNQLGNRLCALCPGEAEPVGPVRAASEATHTGGGFGRGASRCALWREDDRPPCRWIIHVDEAVAETKGVGIACQDAASGRGSGLCGAGPAVVRG